VYGPERSSQVVDFALFSSNTSALPWFYVFLYPDPLDIRKQEISHTYSRVIHRVANMSQFEPARPDPSEHAPNPSSQPELVFGLVGPIGVDMASVQSTLEASLRSVGYTPYTIHLTKLLPQTFPKLPIPKTYQDKIDMANRICEKSKKNDILARLAILEICRIRATENARRGLDDAPTVPMPATAYIIRQLKREQEVEFLRSIYGRRFVQISAIIDRKTQIKAMEAIVIREQPELHGAALNKIVEELFQKDQEEDGNDFGQKLSRTFQYGDFFVDASHTQSLGQQMFRFIHALFGANEISPTKDEFGSYLAKAAALRTVDLSRQVGAAILNRHGDIISLGSNEVPRPGGGNYWSTDPNPQRDIDRKYDANKLATSQIISDFVRTIEEHGSLTRPAEEIISDEKFQALLKKSLISDITEFGRMTHAEMSALMDAVRLGRSVDDATIYVTTYPCHNCAKHLIASGIMRIVYIEPYPKSRAMALHDDAITVDQDAGGKVVLSHFHGIAP
jgi:deoxycytidylate deaminase